jgi:hypothetical protein
MGPVGHDPDYCAIKNLRGMPGARNLTFPFNLDSHSKQAGDECLLLYIPGTGSPRSLERKEAHYSTPGLLSVFLVWQLELSDDADWAFGVKRFKQILAITEHFGDRQRVRCKTLF